MKGAIGVKIIFPPDFFLYSLYLRLRKMTEN